MRKLFICLFAMVLILSMGACGGGGGGGGVVDNIIDNAASGFIGGTWSGTVTSKTGRGVHTFTMTITQNAAGDLAGRATISGTFSDSKGVVAGTVSNPNGNGDIAFAVSWGSGDTMSFIGTYTASTMKGAFSSLTLPDAGTFALGK